MRVLNRGSLPPRRYAVDWDGKDEFGSRVGAGVYFLRLDAKEYQETRKLVVLR